MVIQFIFSLYYNQSFLNIKQQLILKKLYNLLSLNFIKKNLIFFNSWSNNLISKPHCVSYNFEFPKNYFLLKSLSTLKTSRGIVSDINIVSNPNKNSRVFSYIRSPHVHNKSHKQFIFQLRKKKIIFFFLSRSEFLLIFLNKIFYFFRYYRFFSEKPLNFKFSYQVNYRFKGFLNI